MLNILRAISKNCFIILLTGSAGYLACALLTMFGRDICAQAGRPAVLPGVSDEAGGGTRVGGEARDGSRDGGRGGRRERRQ